MPRYKLRTLLIVLALGPMVIAWVVTPTLLLKIPMGDGRQVAFKASRFGPSGRGITGDGISWVEARVGDQRVRVESTIVWQPQPFTTGLVVLPEAWQNIEVTLNGKDFRVVLDGKTLK